MKTLLIDRRDDIVTVILNRPDVRNAFDATLIAELTETFESLSARAAVLAGTGKVFCAGADIDAMRRSISAFVLRKIGASWARRPSVLLLASASAIGETYHAHRKAVLSAWKAGLAKTYNRFHDPHDASAEIAKLRQLHDGPRRRRCQRLHRPRPRPRLPRDQAGPPFHPLPRAPRSSRACWP